MPSIDDPTVFLTGMVIEGDGEVRVKEGEKVYDGSGGSFGNGYNVEDDEEKDVNLATPVRKRSVGMVFSDGGEEDDENDDDDRYGFDGRDGIVHDDKDGEDGSPRDGCFEEEEEEDNDDDVEHVGYEGYTDNGNADKDGYGHNHHDRNLDHHNNTAFSTPSTVITPLPDPDEPLPSIEPHSSPAYRLSSPKSRSVSKSAGNTPSSHHVYNHRQQRNSSGGVGGSTNSHLPHQYDDNTTTTLQYHLRDQHLHGSPRNRRRRRTSLSTNLSAISTVSSIPSSIMGLGKGSFERPDDPTSAFAPMSRRPRPVVNRSEMLRMMPRSVPAQVDARGGSVVGDGRGFINGKNGDVRNGRVESSCDRIMNDGGGGDDDDEEINSPSRGKGRSGRARKSNEKDGDDGDYDYEMDRRQIQMQQSALVIPPSPSPSQSPSSSSSQIHSHHGRHHEHLQPNYDDQAQAHAHARNHTRLQSPMTATKFFTPQPQLPPPLVLLHATILPPALPLPYSPSALSALAPPFIHRNARLLAEKLDAQVLARGVLVAHPHEDYELLEERILESLELVVPRISVCGHFLGGDAGIVDEVRDENEEEQENEEAEEEDDDEEDIGNGRIIDEYIHDHDNHVHEQNALQGQIASPVVSSSISGAAAARPHCTTCAHPIRIPFSPDDLNPNGHNQLISHADNSHSTSASNDDFNNTSTLRWDVRVYAANGLMRAGAWATAWREMERVDVQIGIWIPEGLKGRLEEWDREHGYVDGVDVAGHEGVEDSDAGDKNCLYDLDNAIELENGEEKGTDMEANDDGIRGRYDDYGRYTGGDDHARNVGNKLRRGSKPDVVTKSDYDSLPRTPTANDTSSPVASKLDRRQQMPTLMQMDESLANKSKPTEQSRELPNMNQKAEDQFRPNGTVPDYDDVNGATKSEEGNQTSTPVNMPSSPPPLLPGYGIREAGAISDHASSFSSSSIASAAKAKDDDRTFLSPSPSSSRRQHKQEATPSLTHGGIDSVSTSLDKNTHKARPDINQSHHYPHSSSILSSHPNTTDQPNTYTSSLSSSAPSNTPRQPVSSNPPPTSKPYTSLITRHLHQPQNIIIILLSILVAFLAMRGEPALSAPRSPPSSSLSGATGSVDSAGIGANIEASAIANAGGEKLAGSIPVAAGTAGDGAAELAAIVVTGKEEEEEYENENEEQGEREELALPFISPEDEHRHGHEYGTIDIAGAKAEAEAEAKSKVKAEETEAAHPTKETTKEDKAADIPNVHNEEEEQKEIEMLAIAQDVIEEDAGEDLVDALLDS